MNEIYTELQAIVKEWKKNKIEQPSNELIQKFNILLKHLYENGWNQPLGHENELPETYLPAFYLENKKSTLDQLDTRLYNIAQSYRSSQSNSCEEQEAIQCYAETIEEMFRIGWDGHISELSAELPEKHMPKCYTDYWEYRLKEYQARKQGIMLQLRDLVKKWINDTGEPHAGIVEKFRLVLDQLGPYTLAGWEMELPDKYLPGQYLALKADKIKEYKKELQKLAAGFHENKGEPERKDIIKRYTLTIKELLYIGWDGFLQEEQHLPQEQLPPAFIHYFENEMKKYQASLKRKSDDAYSGLS